MDRAIKILLIIAGFVFGISFLFECYTIVCECYWYREKNDKLRESVERLIIECRKHNYSIEYRNPDDSKNWVTLPYVVEEVETNTFEVINGDGSPIVHTNLITFCRLGAGND